MDKLQHGGPPRPCLRRLRAPRDQRGTSLIEVLLAVAIMSIVVFGIMAGFQTTATVSGNAGERSRLQGALSVAIERSSTISYPGCASLAQIDATAQNAGIASPGYTAKVTSVSYVVPTGSCTSATSALMLRVTVTSRKGDSLAGDVVLRNPAARP